ncbi:MAG: hypothetical protein CMG26_06090 [Candidatus Marinimicrobia bacterium]|nr:hypothetical protein [Candidatus Neomarinimicrobiota bacterium]|tara:strand:- start:108 stop:1052 length:945 start_codon:yes stop_codon:yes gene_type:complete
MITKTFEKFSNTSVGISSFMLLCVAFYYTTLELKWSFFESSLLNGIIIFGALMLSNFAIDTITRELTIMRSSRNAYHLLLYPLIVLSYPIESVDLRFILSSAAIWAAWRNMRIFIELTNPTKKIKRLFDASVLLSFSSLIIVENLIIFIYPLLALITSNIKRDFKHYIIIFTTPIIILPSLYVLLSFLSLDSYFFSSYFFADQPQAIDEHTFNLTYSYVPIVIVFVLFVISVIIKFSRTYSSRRRVLDVLGVLFIILTSLFFTMDQLSGSEFHYLSLPVVYMVSQIFAKKINSLYVNFIFIILIVSTLTFNFLI